MLDLYGLPGVLPGVDSKVQIFNRPSTVTNIEWMTWLRPRGVTMASVFCIGGGGGGGGGFTGAASSARGGGGSGGSSGHARGVLFLNQLERLYIQVGAGGVGVGSGGGQAPSGVLSWVGVFPDTTSQNMICQSGAVAATGGTTGTGAAGGAAGAASTVGTIANANFSSLGAFLFIAGQVGVSGGSQAGANGTGITFQNNGLICTSGTGGGGTTSADFQGGAFAALANTYISEQRPATPAAGSFDGSGGAAIWNPPYFFGGGGGSSSNTGVGGKGGNGAHGGGGGGGGGGTTGGRGGDGGNGLVIITCW